MFLKAKRMSGLAAVGLVFLVGCAADGADEEANPDNVCGDESWCSPVDVEGAYFEFYHPRLFCGVEEARRLVSAGDIDAGELVGSIDGWGADMTRDGDPVIVDVSQTSPDDVSLVVGALERAIRDLEGERDSDSVRNCLDEVTQETIQKSEGPYEGPRPGQDDD